MPGFNVIEGTATPVESDQSASASIEQLLIDESDEQQFDSDDNAGITTVTDGQQPPLNQMGGDEQVQPDDDAGDQDDGQVQPTYKIKVDGQEVEVNHDELIAGYYRQSDYTRKTQELAQQRLEFQSLQQQTAQDREQYRYLVGALGERLQRIGGPEPDWQKLAAEDPAGYVQQKAAWDHRQGLIKATEQEADRLDQETQQEYQRNRMNWLQGQRNALLTVRRDLQDPAKEQEFFTGIMQYAQHHYGFAPQELQAIGDHRLYLIAEKAMLYDRLKAQGTPKVKTLPKGAAPPPTLQPGSRRDVQPGQRRARAAKERLERTGSVRDAASLIESML